jgi:6-pyruvoyltetrahydropterin/6-carboxytetrahydropterin synthase
MQVIEYICMNQSAEMHTDISILFLMQQQNLDRLGRIIDFSVLKEKFHGWIDDNWDHGFIYYEKDKEMEAALNMIEGQKKFALPYNPTAENLAKYLHTVVAVEQMKDTGIRINKVEVWETENAFATAS